MGVGCRGTDPPTPTSMPYVIGLTGNIACGKSTVAAMLRELGAEIIDADKVAHAVMAPGGPAYGPVVQAFGPEIVAADGAIDRRKLGAIVFSDPVKLRLLDQLVHPHTTTAIRAMIKASSARVIVVEAIKLIEAGTYQVCDSVWVVACEPIQQVERLMAGRGLSREESERRIRAQSPTAEKIPFATVVIDTTTTVEETRRLVLDAWRRLVPQ
jgi:dephospho-CoA kinase